MAFPEEYKGLFELIKKKLRVTFSQFDEEIQESILEGMAEISERVGKIDFTDETKTSSIKARKLLKLYCQYDWNNSLNFFWEDHHKDVLSLQICAAKERREANESK
ncbi:hypothetical protein I6N96_03215 [Enterococcus sp. BWM-S5]|uniref:Phage protein n=1 Tax=Enterococcus larvae TaxID=2794352 RepID=A0ABS4CF57_9ENTE|nr:hypothetical protein [Enterococcus larvae]MBP1045273.1 hypothetical protein [Enterococcus larvae]